MDRLVFFAGDTAEIEVRIFDAAGNPVSVGSVRIQAGTFTDYAELVNGSCAFSYPCESIGPVSIVVNYDGYSTGNTTYTACSETVAIEVSVTNEGDTVAENEDTSRLYVAGAIFVVLLAIVIAFQVLANRKV